MKKVINSLVILVGGAALCFAAGCMNVAKKMQEAEAAYKTGQYQKAYELTAKVLKKDKQNVSAMVMNGWSLHQLQKESEAGTMLAQAASLGANDFGAQYFYGQYLVDTGDFNTAMTPLRQAFKINADTAKPQPESLLVLLSRCCLEQNLPEGAQYLQGLRRFPDMSTSPSLYNDLGTLWTNTGKYPLAEKAFKDAWAKDPQNLIAPQNLAVLYDQYLKDPKQALRHYKYCYAQAAKAGDTVGAERYQSRIAALERENPKTPAAVKPAAHATKKAGAASGKSSKPAKKGTKAKSTTKKSAKTTAIPTSPKHG